MKAENVEERRKLFKRFALIYLGSLALLVLAFLSLPGWSDSHAEDPAPVKVHDNTVQEALKAQLDSARQQVQQLRQALLKKDSLVGILAAQTAQDPALVAYDKKSTGRTQSVDQQELRLLKEENTGLQQRFDEQTNTGAALREQVTNLQHANELLRTRIAGADRRNSPQDATKAIAGATEAIPDGEAGSTSPENASAEHRVAVLDAELRLAEVNCDLSRADARQIVYNAKQREGLLSAALTILNQLMLSPDAEIQKKARQKMTELRSIVSTVHD